MGLSCRLGLEEIKRRTRKLKSTLSLLSKEYVGTTSPLKFQCGKCGKKVSLSWESLVRSEGRCAACTWSAKKLTLKEIKERLKKINPNLKILGKYKHSSLPLRCECKVCHVQFSKPWNDLRQRITACSCRRVWSGEEEVRRVLEGITGWVFPKGMPSSVPFLNGLSLDGYNEEHRIGYEFQGAQHYQLVNFGGSKDTWRKLRRRKLNDKKKRVACLRHGVLLLVVPYWKKDVEGFLKKKLKEWRKRR